MTDETTSGGLSRRNLLKKGAIAGGIAWTAPVISSLATPAAAAVQGPSPGSFSCCHCYNGSPGEAPFVAAVDGPPSNPNPLYQGILDSADHCDAWCSSQGYVSSQYCTGSTAAAFRPDTQPSGPYGCVCT